MNINPELRLGVNNFNEIKNHEFFESINWDELSQKKITPPIVPKNR